MTDASLDDHGAEAFDDDHTQALPQFDYGQPSPPGEVISQSLKELFPELFAQLPSMDDRPLASILPNPFSSGSGEVIARYDTVRRAPSIVPTGGQVNGYVKFRFRPNQRLDRRDASEMPVTEFQQADFGVHHRPVPMLPGISKKSVPYVPSNFGSSGKLDSMDRELLTFCNAHRVLSMLRRRS